MKILYDYQILAKQKYGGISRYFSELFRYNKLNGIDQKLGLFFTDNEYLNNIKIQKYFKFPFQKDNNRFRKQTRAYINKLNLHYSIYEYKKGDYDIFHPTYYNPYFFEYIVDKPLVVTAFDMIHKKFPQYFSANDRTVKYQKRIFEKANVIISISENTRQDIIKEYDIEGKRIITIYLASTFNKINNTKTYNRNYILYVGERSRYKNFHFYIESIINIIKSHNVNILCAGGGKFCNKEKGFFKELDILENIFQKDMNDFELSKAYNNALFFVFPSLYEGFGIPILEAFANSCPSICSNSSSLPEVGGDAVLYFNPYDKTEINDVTKEIIENETLRNELILSGYKQLQKFSWKKMAEETEQVYKEMLK